MEIVYRKKFLKELSQISSAHKTRIEQFVFEQFPSGETIYSTEKLERLKGYPGYFKIRFGDYRIGLRIAGNEIIFERILHRKDIYRFYP